MPLTRLASNAAAIARQLMHRHIVAPIRRWRWKQISRPTVIRGARGHRFRLYPGQPLDQLIYVDGLYERSFLEYLRARLPPSRVMLDVGANIGNHAIYLSERFEQVHCFEPSPAVADRLEENIQLNGLANIQVHRVGLGSCDGLLPFCETRHDLGLARFVNEEAEATTKLPVTTGDRWVAESRLQNVDFIKIDVEGLELEVLKGLSRVIGKFTPLIAFESWGDADGVENAIEDAAPDYRLYELVGPPGGNRASKAWDVLNHGMTPRLRQVRKLKGRSLPYVLAIPARMLSRFQGDIEEGSVVGATGIEPVTPPV